MPLELGFNQLSKPPPNSIMYLFINVSVDTDGLVDVPSIPAEPHNYRVIKVLFEACQRDE